ncbi:hypothetical protein Vretimale_2135 [Volvox reticuliferus]|uniref:Uncharacterized protein n=1 Tax=Volvox reticuliferus TaxID=1737510 RepID=A0A8J4FH96_9CHLO|nr:hypothetical protein Vretifemale_4418 [Volvox reticuliferus]GIL96297.1 hypothetical protein Vretimale_2135 [Volvox reticuliferus]
MANTTLLQLPVKALAGSHFGLRSHARLSPRLPVALIKLGLSCSKCLCSYKSFRGQRTSPLGLTVSSATSDALSLEDDEGDIDLDGSYEIDNSELGPPPDARYQLQLHIRDRKAWRSKAETMAKEKRLINIQIGQLGITPSFLRACADVLQKHSLVRVKLGDGCGLERRSVATLLEKYLDCICVHQIGFTVTLYRQAGLPRPSNTLRECGDNSVASSPAAVLQAEAKARSAAAQEKQKRKKIGQQRPQQRPPEFSML